MTLNQITVGQIPVPTPATSAAIDELFFDVTFSVPILGKVMTCHNVPESVIPGVAKTTKDFLVERLNPFR